MAEDGIAWELMRKGESLHFRARISGGISPAEATARGNAL